MSRLTAPDRMRRLLAVIPWVSGRGDVTLQEIAERFDYPVAGLRRDLTEVVQYVGAYPYTPDMLIEVDLDEEAGRVRFELADYFRQPLQLTPNQALSLLSAGLGLLESSTGASASLETGLAKVADRFGLRLGDDIDVRLGGASPEVVTMVRAAVGEHRMLEVDYHSPISGASTRVLEPLQVFNRDGEWYLSAYCHRAEADRTFRLDRVFEVRETGRSFDPRPAGDARTLASSEHDIRVRLELAPDAAWVVEAFPVEDVDRSEDRLIVTLAVVAARWLEVLLLQLGGSATLLNSSPPLAGDFRAISARRVLDRYHD